MTIKKFKTYKNDSGLPYLSEVQSYEYEMIRRDEGIHLADVVMMMVEAFKLNKETEEFTYAICFNTKMKILGVFEISHGDILSANMGPREVFQKALLIGASGVIVVHNHPSGSCKASKDDESLYKRLYDAGEILGVMLFDSIIIGDREAYSIVGKRSMTW